MRSWLVVFIVSAAASAQTPCRIRDVPCEYAAETRKQIAAYRKMVGEQVRVSERKYLEIADVAAQGNRDEAETREQIARVARSERLADEFIESRKPVSLWKEMLLEYGEQSFEAYQRLLTEEQSAAVLYLDGVQSLQADLKKAEALDKLLAALIEKRPLLQQLQGLVRFADETEEEFNKLLCDGLKKDLDAKKKQLDGLTAEAKASPHG